MSFTDLIFQLLLFAKLQFVCMAFLKHANVDHAKPQESANFGSFKIMRRQMSKWHPLLIFVFSHSCLCAASNFRLSAFQMLCPYHVCQLHHCIPANRRTAWEQTCQHLNTMPTNYNKEIQKNEKHI